MEYNNKQAGRTRVNIVSDKKNKNKKNKKNKKDKKDNNETGMDKLIQLQKEFFKDGMNPTEYKNYVQGKINNDHFYYKNISADNFKKLNKRYSRITIAKENNLNLMLSERKRKKRQKSLFKDKKRTIIHKQKRKIIELLFKEITKTNALGITRNAMNLSSDPDQLNNTKLLLFLGGRYLDGHDKNWVNVYQRLVSGNSAHLFGINSYDTFNQYVVDYDNIVEEIIENGEVIEN